MQIFGYEIRRKEEEKQEQLPSIVPKTQDDGAISVAAGGAYGTAVDLDGSLRTEAELITRYRDMALTPECDSAVDEIVNESMSIDEDTIVDINLEKTELSDAIKSKIQKEFNNCLKILDFNNNAYDIYRRWYVDGRLYYHVIIDPKNIKEGIKEVRYIDPRKIRKVREIVNKKIITNNNANPVAPGDITLPRIVNEYYMYNDRGFALANKTPGSSGTYGPNVGIKVAKDSILHITSGITDNQGNLVLSYLHKAIKALNQLRTLEDALVIYRLSRAPERRIWYIDVGNLPKMKAEQYVRDIMVKHKNKLVYNAQSGEIEDSRKFMTLLEDYWLPRREGGRGTEVTTLPGGQTLGQMDDVLYFQKKFLQTLCVPVSRLNSDALFSIGRATEITRDELKFTRFVIRLRAKFAQLFTKMLEKQVVLKGIMTFDEWSKISSEIKYNYSKDNYFNELKDAEILANRINNAANMQNVASKYVSHEWIRKNVMMQSDEDIKKMDQEINKENKSNEPRWISVPIEQAIQAKEASEMQETQSQQLDQQVQQQQQQIDQQNSPEGQEQNKKLEQLRQDKIFVDQMKQKGAGNRSIQDQTKYVQASQRLARNKDLVAGLK